MDLETMKQYKSLQKCYMRITDLFSLMYKELQTLLPGKERNIENISQEDHTRRANYLSLEGI